MDYRGDQFGDQFGDEINYYGSGAASKWAVVETFATVGQWHAAKGILARHGIAGHMRSTDDPDEGYDLLVLETELEWARDLLASGGESQPFEERTHGFPIDPDPAESWKYGAERSGLPVEPGDLTPDRQKQYDAVIWLLWGLLVFIVLLMVLGFIL